MPNASSSRLKSSWRCENLIWISDRGMGDAARRSRSKVDFFVLMKPASASSVNPIQCSMARTRPRGCRCWLKYQEASRSAGSLHTQATVADENCSPSSI